MEEIDNLIENEEIPINKEIDELEEGIITNEPPGNEYPKIEKDKLDRFPYFLIGQIKSSFNIPFTKRTQKQGVGILIGPSIVLTAAHVLCQKLYNEKKEKTMFNAIEVYFNPATTENFQPLSNPIYSDNYYINEKYIDLLQEKVVDLDKVDEKYKNDWGLIFLPYNVGDTLKKLFDVDQETQEKMVVKNGLYSYYLDFQNQIENLKMNLTDETTKEISMIAYTDREKDVTKQKEGKTARKKTNHEPYNELDSSLIDENHEFNYLYAESNLKYLNEKRNSKNLKINKTEKSSQIKTNDYVLFKKSTHESKNHLMKQPEEDEKDYQNSFQMCETKGFLYYPKTETTENFLYYQFNTLKGQSGAPVFLRIKNKKRQDKNLHDENFDPSVHSYSYIMIGLHIRRGPNKISPFLTDVQAFHSELESKILKPKGNPDKNKEKKVENSIDKKPKDKNVQTIQEILRNEQGECEYNISLRMTTSILQQIQTLLKNNYTSYHNQNSNSFSNVLNFNETTFKSNYTMINLYYNNILKLKGLFSKTTELKTIFMLSGGILNVKKKFICMELKNSDDIKYRTYHKQLYEYDKNKKLSEIVTDHFGSLNSNSVSNSEYCINYELGLNISLYSEFLCERIMNKVSQNQNIELSLLKQNPVKYSKFFMVAIFVEIKEFNAIYPLFGELFQTLKNKLGIKN